jgi:hypothetical protein
MLRRPRDRKGAAIVETSQAGCHMGATIYFRGGLARFQLLAGVQYRFDGPARRTDTRDFNSMHEIPSPYALPSQPGLPLLLS